MNYRRFGGTNWNVSEIGYGMWGMGSWSGADDEQSMRCLQRAVDLGCNLFDSAWYYGSGRTDRLLGDLVRENPRKRLYTTSKIPPKNQKWPATSDYSLDDCYPPDYIEEFVVKLLDASGLSSYDLMQFHTWDDTWVDDDRLAAKIEDLKRQKLINAFGVSLNRWEPWNGVRSVRSGLVDAVQVIYNIFDQDPEDELLPACKEKDVAVIARVPFDEGALTGTLTKQSKWPEGDWRNVYFDQHNLGPSVERAEALKLLTPDGMTLPEMALRFVLSNPTVSTTIPGMRTLEHVQSNVAASDAGALPANLIEQLQEHRWKRQWWL